MKQRLLLSAVALLAVVVAAGRDDPPRESYPRTKAEIRKAIDKLKAGLAEAEPAFAAAPSRTGTIKAGKLAKGTIDAALCRLKIYRMLAGVPFDDIAAEEGLNDKSQHAATLMSIMKKITHTPAKPVGVPDVFFKTAAEGAIHCNLHQGQNSLAAAIDGFLDDSDPSNIGKLGHRQWALNPWMSKTGFGACEGYCAMWANDCGRANVPDFDSIAFPARGYHPVKFFGARWAWSVMLGAKKFQAPGKGQVKIAVSRRKGKGAASLKIGDFNVIPATYGGGTFMIFRPAGVEVADGAVYEVTVTGLKSKDGADAQIAYVVEFFE